MEALSGVTSSQQLAGLLSAYIPLLARDGNPYGILRKTIRDVVLLPQSKVAKPLYILGSVGAAVDVLLFVSVWFIRWRKNSFWLVRKATSQDEVYYLAHSSLPYSGLNVLMCLSLQGFAWRAADRYLHVLHLRSYADKRAPRFASPWVLLGSFIATSIAFLASSLPPVVKSAKAYSDTMLDWVAIDEMLGEAASLYAGTASASSAAVANSIAPRLFALIARKQRLYRLFRLTYLLYAAWAFLLGGTFCVFGIAYARAVKRSLNEFKDRSPTASTVFSQTVRNLIALLLGFTLFIVVVSVNSIWVGILSAEVLDSGPVMQLSAIIPLLAAVFGILVMALTMFYQALTAPTVYVPPSLSRTSTFLRSRSQSYLPKQNELAAHYTRFALAASEFLPDQANLTLAGDLSEAGRAKPFEDLELQPANDAGSIKSVEVDGLDEVTDEKY
ncbi:hypothetical protein B0A53_03876 [Rhodotorula sp. CCFEE 5036]|nr:hypothetical protein B0A53_03876 [Rhodotorula sp. CCFEE 5036]